MFWREISSQIFLFDPKKTDHILNLKKLNQDCETTHFKMEYIKQVIDMIKPNMYLASLDIKILFIQSPQKVIEIHVVK